MGVRIDGAARPTIEQAFGAAYPLHTGRLNPPYRLLLMASGARFSVAQRVLGSSLNPTEITYLDRARFSSVSLEPFCTGSRTECAVKDLEEEGREQIGSDSHVVTAGLTRCSPASEWRLCCGLSFVSCSSIRCARCLPDSLWQPSSP